MNQTEQVTSITGADIDAAIQDERVTLLEAAAKAIFSLQQQATDHTGRIEQLETCAVINAETIGHVAELRRIVTEQGEHIERLKRDIELNSGLINCLQNVGLKDNERIAELERRVARLAAEAIPII